MAWTTVSSVYRSTGFITYLFVLVCKDYDIGAV